MPGRNGPEKRLPPWVIQAVGLVVIVASFFAWYQTGRETSLLVAAGLTMIAYGQIKIGDGNDK